jgi:hypothetical protein
LHAIYGNVFYDNAFATGDTRIVTAQPSDAKVLLGEGEEDVAKPASSSLPPRPPSFGL